MRNCFCWKQDSSFALDLRRAADEFLPNRRGRGNESLPQGLVTSFTTGRFLSAARLSGCSRHLGFLLLCGLAPVLSCSFSVRSLAQVLPDLPPLQADYPATAAPVLPNLPALPSGGSPQAVNPSASISPPPSNYQYPANNNVYPSPVPAAERPTPAQPAAYSQPAQDLRAIQQGAPQSPPPAASMSQQQGNATGFPYAAPAPRTGRYATSPYLGPRMTTSSYPGGSGGIPARTVSAPSSGLSVPTGTYPNQSAAIPPGQAPGTLPGIYPTTNSQVLQANVPPAGAVPGSYVPPTYTPDMTPNLYSANNAGYAPLFTMGQENYNVLLGRGLFGQPTVYVPGQSIRNFFRYISP